MAAERLQKLLARAGFGSRRACEEFITAGRVTVDGRAVTELGAKADLLTQDVRLDGTHLRPERPEYWLLNKPKGVVCTNCDPAGRSRPIDLMKHYTPARLFPVGRLDADSTGLLLMTNDGLFANRLTHPRYEVAKTYVATVAGEVTTDDLRRLRRGMWLAEGRTRQALVRLIRRSRSRSMLEVTIREGRNRQIRRMLARLGHNVWDLTRTRIGRLTLRGVGVGRARPLEPDEVEYLRRLPETPPETPERPPRRPGREARPRQGQRVGPVPVGEAPTVAGAPPFDRRERRPFGGEDRGREGGGRPPRRERPPFGGPRNRGRAAPEGYERDSSREKRSRRQHDTDGTGKEGAGHRGHAGGGGGRERGRRDRPPFGGRRPRRHPPE
jgi:23S rRNA pseudouridine2605 synthase